MAEVGVTAASVAGLSVYAVMKAKYDELWNSQKARLDELEQRSQLQTLDSMEQATRHHEEINALRDELSKARAQYPDLLEAHKYAVRRAYEYGKLLDQFHDNIPVRQRVANRMDHWLPPRDLPEKGLECAYSYLSIPVYPRLNFEAVTASEWEEALNECSRWHGYPAPKDWGLRGTGDVQISRSITRHTEHAMQEGQGEQVRAAVDARKKAGDLGLSFQQHAESRVKTQALFHAGIPAWVTREMKLLGKEAKAVGALRWLSMAEKGKALEVSVLRVGG
ncbi:MAG: hypothetical protein M1826_004281 [Phylliscum demangeonii]|nr:MAG: hypothetical protein M1826_004281 [Phylliscum demangeonii]